MACEAVVLDDMDDTVESIEEVRGIIDMIFGNLVGNALMVELGDRGGETPAWGDIG